MKPRLSSVTVVPVTFFLFLTAVSASAAVPSGGALGVEETRSALGLPLENRIATISAQGEAGIRNLQALMFDENGSIDLRWRAVTATARIGGANSKSVLAKALRAKEWYMRNAALLAIKGVDRELATAWSKELLSDDALIVRMAAVDTLGELNDAKAPALLWQKLYAKENFKGQLSLAIRRRIVETLARIDDKSHQANFVKVLSDADESLHQPAIAALERITGKKLTRSQWLKADAVGASARL
jgi:HEAT repeat protein